MRQCATMYKQENIRKIIRNTKQYYRKDLYYEPCVPKIIHINKNYKKKIKKMTQCKVLFFLNNYKIYIYIYNYIIYKHTGHRSRNTS